jgi:DNA-binding LytR/AlgR family response regulator
MKVIIIEDEVLAARRLKQMIHEYDSTIEIVAELESVEESIKWFQNNAEPDLIFLDIHLEDDLSFAIFEKVNINAPVIFTTAFDEYAIKAFKMKSIDYLLKPIVQSELAAALKKYKELSAKQRPSHELQKLYEMIIEKKPQYRERFSVAFGQKIKTFTVNEIAYFFSQDGATYAILKNNTSYPVDVSLDKLMNELSPGMFFRINRQMIVSIHAIKEVIVYPKSRLKLDLAPEMNDVFVSLDKVTPFKDWFSGKR